ncbi:hypothetical protein [Helicobacter pylori]|uniref:hypothetical protein n=1 Tax=Helicobacter pylori TaxID=210 RepID=UPI0018E28CB1|nr:hypothetical protein [Helicobacter pylori]
MLKECLNCKKFCFNWLIGCFILVFKEIVQGGEPIKEHKIINILQNHPNLTLNLKKYPHLLILTCGVAQTNDLFVPNKKQKTSVKEKTQVHCIKITLRET